MTTKTNIAADSKDANGGGNEANNKRKNDYSAPALEKGLDILELLAHEPNGLTLSHIANKLSRSVGQIFRMLAVLEKRGYVKTADSSDTYHLSLKMFVLSHRQTPIGQLTQAAAAEMKRLAIATEQSCHLSIYSQGKIIIIAQENSPADRGLQVRLGAEADLIDSCSGHLWLAFSQPDQRRSMLSERANFQNKHQTPINLEQQLDTIAEKGFERTASRQINGITDIGFPVFSYDGAISAALTIPFLQHIDGSQGITMDEATARLKQSAQTISEALGYFGEN